MEPPPVPLALSLSLAPVARVVTLLLSLLLITAALWTPGACRSLLTCSPPSELLTLRAERLVEEAEGSRESERWEAAGGSSLSAEPSAPITHTHMHTEPQRATYACSFFTQTRRIGFLCAFEEKRWRAVTRAK